MRIRKATIRDYEILKNMKLLSKREELRYSESLKPIRKTKKHYCNYLEVDLTRINRVIFIALENKKILGMVLGQYFRPLPISKFNKKGYISNLYVHKDYRKRGIGKKLVNRLMRWFKENAVHYISLEIHVKNRVAQKLYKDLGFEDYTIKLTRRI
jgi:ribosomal protein S18 acetylase RimI-like enzyme